MTMDACVLEEGLLGRAATPRRSDEAALPLPQALSMTVVVPSYNEAGGLLRVLPALVECSRRNGWEILVVDDASDDGTEEVLRRFSGQIRVLRNPENLGYGASIKKGILACETEWVATFDGDGQHRVEDLERLATRAGDCDAVIGERTSRSHCSAIRRPGKWVLGKVANVLVGKKLPDVNCGLRLFRRQAVNHVLRLTSDGFSFATSSLIALMKLGFDVVHEPVTTTARVGCSTVRQFTDGFNSVLFILRLIMLFDPLRIMLPVAGAFFAIGVMYQLTSFALYGFDLNKLTLLLWVFALIIFLVALVADQVSALRREVAAFASCAPPQTDAGRVALAQLSVPIPLRRQTPARSGAVPSATAQGN
jgi:glycosyltransferase involved in cell wall biosynthesis